jgi:hypothetical protein
MEKSDLLVLKELSVSNDLVPVESIPESFKSDFYKFFFGKTVVVDEKGQVFAYPHDIKKWVRHLLIAYKE